MQYNNHSFSDRGLSISHKTLKLLQILAQKIVKKLKNLSEFFVKQIKLIFNLVFYFKESMIKKYFGSHIFMNGLHKLKIKYTIQSNDQVFNQIMEKKDIPSFELYLNKRIKTLSNIIHENILDKQKQLIDYDTLKELVMANKVNDYIEELIKNQKYQNAYRFMLAFEYSKESYQQLVDQLPDNQFGLAGKIIKERQLDISRYPNVLEKFKEDSLNYYMARSKIPHEKIEELFMNDKGKLNFLFQYLYRTNKNKALQMARRQNLVINDSLIDQQIQSQELVQNPLFQFDNFLPTKEILSQGKLKNFVKLSDFGILESDVILLENKEQFTEEIRSEILNEKQVGIDTEFSNEIPETKFSNNKQNKLGLLQIATQKKVYILDMLTLQSSNIYKEFMLNLVESKDIKKIGQGVEYDILLLIKQIKQSNNIEKNNMVELSSLFKQKFKNEFKTNLAHQCETLFKKELDKIEQISNWHLRPLRKAQIHYAALDAYVCLKLYDILEKI